MEERTCLVSRRATPIMEASSDPLRIANSNVHCYLAHLWRGKRDQKRADTIP
jgi:hypothetical protein